LLDISRDTQDGSYGSYPTESVKIQTDGDTVYIAVISTDTSENAVIDIFVRGYSVSIPFGTPQYSVGSPGDARGSLTVGATSWRNDALEPYSSQGPTTDERLKPDISAPAGVSGSTYGSYGFDGTSASTPHVAAAAALVWEAHSEFTRQQVIDYLINASIDLGISGPDTGFGYGRLLLPSPDSIIGPTPQPITEDATPTATLDALSPTPTEKPPGSSFAPVPTFTPVVFSTLEPEYPKTSNQVGRAALLGILVLGPGCGGTALVLVGLVTMIRAAQPKKRHGDYAAGGQPPAMAPTYQPPQGSFPHQPRPSEPQPASKPPAPAARNMQPKIEEPKDQTTTQGVKSCPQCGTVQKMNAKFCRKCGTPLSDIDTPRLCPYCNREIKSRSRFCPHCGKTLSSHNDAANNG
ncbi:MAG: S8 family serine peptidase, partial [Anaerolineae bacterium]|nr:S8 family serine peptidase [Anaerolineae bacterium]